MLHDGECEGRALGGLKPIPTYMGVVEALGLLVVVTFRPETVIQGCSAVRF